MSFPSQGREQALHRQLQEAAMKYQGGKREVAAMAWPLAVGMLSFTLMGVVDTMLMGYVGTAQQAGVGLATTLFFFFLSFFLGLTTGPQSLVAAAHGAGDVRRQRRAGGAGIVMGPVSGLLAAGFLLVAYKPILNLAVQDVDLAQSCATYLTVRVWGMPFGVLAMGLLAGLQGLGDTKSRMYVSLICNGLNIVLDLILIFGWGPVPAMHETGAAIATAVSNVVGAMLYGYRYLKLLGKPVMPTAEVMISSIKLGLPMGIQRIIGVLAFTVMSLVLARIGARHLAASEIVLNIVSVSFLPGFGIGEAGGLPVGRSLGSKQHRTAYRALGSARILAVGLMGAFAVVFALWGEAIAGLFTADAEVARLAGVLMRFAAAFQIFDALATVHLCALRGAGDNRFTLAVTTLCSWGLTVPVTLLFALTLDWGAPGAYLGLTLEIAALAAITGWRVRGIATGSVGRLDLLLGDSETREAA